MFHKTGGIASLNHRLMAVTPHGVKTDNSISENEFRFTSPSIQVGVVNLAHMLTQRFERRTTLTRLGPAPIIRSAWFIANPVRDFYPPINSESRKDLT